MRGTNVPDATGYQCQFFFVITEQTEHAGSRAKTLTFILKDPALSLGWNTGYRRQFRYLYQQLHVDSELDSRKRAGQLPLCLL